MKRYICGFLFIIFLTFSPLISIAENISIEETIAESTTELPVQAEVSQDEQVEPYNEEVEPQSDSTCLIINEIMIGSEVNPEKDSWLEFYNPSDQEITMEGWQAKGITAGGRWVNIVSDSTLSIQPDEYFILSYYSNSRYSALAVKPQAQKSSLLLFGPEINIEIKNPNGDICDTAIFNHETSDEFRSYERNDDEWLKSERQINLKDGLAKTYATPGIGVEPDTESGDNQPHNEDDTEEDSTDTEDTQNPTPPEENENDDTQPSPPESEDNNPRPTEQPTNELPSSDTPTYQSLFLINEFMPNPEGTDTENEWIELFNPTNSPINIKGWYLDDADGASNPKKFVERTVIAPNTYLVIKEPYLKLSLKNSNDEVRLLNPNKEISEVISYSDAKENISYSKKSDGTFTWTNKATPGSKNQFPPPPKAYLPDTILFQSIIPNPDGKDSGNESIILKNNINEEVDLSMWKLRNQKNKDYNLENLIINPFEKLTLNPSEIGLGLANKSDQLSLIDPMGNLIDRIYWIEAKSDQVIYKPDYFQDGLRAKVTNIVDGDTFDVTIDSEKFRIRLIGVDTPETVHPTKRAEESGKIASNYLNNLLTNKTVSLSFDNTKTDIYNRLLAYVYLDNILINADLIKNGYGYAYTKYPFKYQNVFVEYEQTAKESGIGIWSVGDAFLHPKKPTTDNPNPDPNTNPNPDTVNDVKLVNDENTVKIENENTHPQQNCPTTGLALESILPNPQKGEAIEYIKVKNISDNTICLNGWQLDDMTDGGSKPFTIKGGGIQPGGIRTFRKTETKITLNNKDDCASLINPDDEPIDRICYGKTHKNEIFTHEGGNWIPKPKSKKNPTKSTNVKQNPPKSTRNTTEFQWEFKNETLNGEIVFVYEEGKILYLKNDKKVIPVSYANSQVSISETKEFLDLNSEVQLDIKSSPNENQLIGISQNNTHKLNTENEPFFTKVTEPHPTIPTELKYLLGLLLVIGGLYILKKKF